MYYLDAVAVRAWLEKQLYGKYREETAADLRLLEHPRLRGAQRPIKGAARQQAVDGGKSVPAQHGIVSN